MREDDKWMVIRLLDPVWLVSCSKQDIDLLNEAEIFENEGFYDVGISYKDMAVQFQTIARMCYTFGINSGCEWEDVNYLYVELMKLQKEIDDRDAKLEAEILSKIPKSVVIHAVDNVCGETSGDQVED